MKHDDLGMFCLPCQIGKRNLLDALIELGASMNIMLTSLFYDLRLLDLCSTNVVVQLGDCSLTKPLGIVKCVLVNANDLVFLVDLLVLNFDHHAHSP